MQFVFVLKRPRHKFSTTTVTHTALHRRLMENITGMFCYSLTSLDSLAQYPDHSLARRNQLAAHQSLASLSSCSSINSSAQPTLVFFFSQHWISCTSSWKPIASAKKLRCLHPATDGRRHGSLILLSSAAQGGNGPAHKASQWCSENAARRRDKNGIRRRW